MDLDFKLAQEKLQKEQKDRKEKARLRLERERKAQQDAQLRREAIEAEQRLRRLEVAQQREREEERERQDLAAGDGVKFNCVLQALPFEASGDKIKLPPSAFDALDGQHALDRGPMLFELTVPSAAADDAIRCHSGVLEFTAAEGFVELPPAIWRRLFLPSAASQSGSASASSSSSSSSLIRVRYVRLPKGNYAKLQAAWGGFSDLPNQRALLETALRPYTSLTEGDTITVRHGPAQYDLRVLELRPAPAVSVIETDMEVDLVPPDSSDGALLLPLVPGKPQFGGVAQGQFSYYKFSLPASDLDAVVRLDLDDSSDADADLYVSKHPLLFPTQYNHHWSCHDPRSKAIRLNNREPADPAGFSIGVFGFRGSARFRISVEFGRPSETASAGQTLGTSTGLLPSTADSAQCSNCRKFVPAATFFLHEAYCSRNNVTCQHEGCGAVIKKDELDKHVHCFKCGKVFGRQELEKHVQIFHQPLNCACGAVLEKEEMVSHQALECPFRIITCRFCGDMVQAGGSAADVRDKIRGFTQHESDCGCRTCPCEFCSRVIMLKDMELHITAVHSQREPPTQQHQTLHDAAQGFQSIMNDVRHDDNLPASMSAASRPPSERAMLVSCPICGKEMHSERDVSGHIDVEH